jgi:LytS/YehU family sensor histidine kinase
LSADENTIAFVFSGNSAEEEHLYYQWRLTGFGDAWSDRSLINRAQFADLAPGTYAFEVRVCDAAGHCNVLPDPWKFLIRRAIWQQWWFWAIISLAVIAMVIVLVLRLRRNRAKENAREKKRLVAELNALTHEQKSMQLQMNPHFIFNALQTVRGRIQADHLDDARHSLTRFAKLMRMMLEMSRSEMVTLEDEIEFLRAYADVEAFSNALPVNFEILGSEDIPMGEISIPPMLIQPVLENAIKYGGNGTEVSVKLHLQLIDDVLHARVDDNGKGFALNSPAHQSASLEIIRNRLMRLRKQGELKIRRAAEGGTSVMLQIPV